MLSTPRIEEIKKLAVKLHEGQFRKDGKTPYYKHLFAVAEILSEYTDNEDIIVAGLMHDTVEDVEGYSHERLVEDCGEKVANIVRGVTEEKFRGHKELPREERVKLFEQLLLRNVSNMEKGGEGSILVACADKIHNLESMMEGFESEGQKYMERFNNPTEQKLWFYRKILEMAKRNITNPISGRFEKTLEKAERMFTEIKN